MRQGAVPAKIFFVVFPRSGVCRASPRRTAATASRLCRLMGLQRRGMNTGATASTKPSSNPSRTRWPPTASSPPVINTSTSMIPGWDRATRTARSPPIRAVFPAASRASPLTFTRVKVSSSASTPPASLNTCGGYPGSLGHEEQDANTYASWGVDYVKYELSAHYRSSRSYRTPKLHDVRMSQALAALPAGPWPSVVPSAHSRIWMPNYINLWRGTGDITFEWT